MHPNYILIRLRRCKSGEQEQLDKVKVQGSTLDAVSVHNICLIQHTASLCDVQDSYEPYAQHVAPIIDLELDVTGAARAIDSSYKQCGAMAQPHALRCCRPLSDDKEVREMSDWQLTPRALKHYPHFDSLISASEAEKLVKDPLQVASHPFYPFIRFIKRWNRFAKTGKLGEEKSRELRYAARRDAYIFSYYRHILSELYESELYRLDLTKSVLGYRRIPVGGLKRGNKSNIHFAYDAFNTIRALGNCYVITLDISKFFESLDHEKLKALWCRLLGAKTLPDDHFKVFKAITSYSIVDRTELYKRLGFYGKKLSRAGKEIEGPLISPKDIPRHLCTGAEFREKIAGKGTLPTIIKKHKEAYGIPQGAPLSDLLANLYLIDFDAQLANCVNGLGGKYFRYSDDILVIVPTLGVDPNYLEAEIRTSISSYGEKLKIKEKKSSIVEYEVSGEGQSYRTIKGARQNGIEYLGFRYDGKRAYIRNSTISRLGRKITMAARAEAVCLVRRYPDKDCASLLSNFNHQEFIQRFLKVENFESKASELKNWTFWTYAKRASEIFGEMGRPISRQLKNFPDIINRRVSTEISKIHARLRD